MDSCAQGAQRKVWWSAESSRSVGTSRKRDLSSQGLEGHLGLDLLRMQEGMNAQQDKQHQQSHTGVLSGNLERVEQPDRRGTPGQCRLGGWQGPSLYAQLRYLFHPEGNREPPKDLEQGVHRGRVARHDLSASLLLGHGLTASSSSQCGAAAPLNSSPPPHVPTARACRLLVHFL